MSAGTVVITGASSGIGRASALYLSERGFRVFAGIRRPEDGAALRAEAAEGLVPIRLDVTDASSIDAAVETVAGAVGESGLYGLVNNAGTNEGGPVEFVELDRLRRQLEVNLVGPVAVTQAFLPLLRRAGGRIVNISSLAGYVAVPFGGAYSASKHGLEAISDSLRRELRPWGISVCVVEPGDIDTPIWEKNRAAAERRITGGPERARELYGATGQRLLERLADNPRRGLPPEAVARSIHTALTARRPRVRYRIGADAKAMRILARLLPDRAIDWIMARAVGS